MFSRIVLYTAAVSVLVTLSILAVVGAVLYEPIVAHLSKQTAASQSVAGVVEEAETVADHESVVVDTVAAVNPAVVSIVVRAEVPVYQRSYEELDPFGGLFGDGLRVPQLREQGTEWQEVGGGSGFVVSEDGLVVTNRHVVADEAAEYSVVFPDGNTYDVSVLATDDILDIAVLQIDGADTETFPYLTFGDSTELQLGQTVIAIGNALAEFENTVSVGVVSGLSRSITAQGRGGMLEQLDQVIQTDAAINLGNSGGPLLNLAGRVVGVNVATSRFGENISFALPADVVSSVVRSVQDTGEIVRPFLGVRYAMLSPRMIEANELDVSYGAIIVAGENGAGEAVLPESPAAEAGLQAGDVITAVDGRALERVSLAQVLRGKQVGQTVELAIWREGDTFTVETTLVAAP